MLQASDYPELRRRLLRGGLSKRRVDRLLRELDDHRLALRERALGRGYERREAEAIAAAELGDATSIVEAMLAQPQLRSFSQRRPWLVYGLLPAWVLIAVSAVTLLGTWFMLQGMGWDSQRLRDAIDALFLFVSHGMLWLIVLTMLWQAHRMHVTPGWPVLGSLLTIVLGSALTMQVAWPGVEGGSGYLNVSYLYGLRERITAAAMICLLLPPFLFAAWRRRLRDANQ